MEWLRKNVSLVFSPVFWGLTLSAFAKIVALNGWLDEATLNIIALWILEITGVRIVWRSAEKLSNKE